MAQSDFCWERSNWDWLISNSMDNWFLSTFQNYRCVMPCTLLLTMYVLSGFRYFNKTESFSSSRFSNWRIPLITSSKQFSLVSIMLVLSFVLWNPEYNKFLGNKVPDITNNILQPRHNNKMYITNPHCNKHLPIPLPLYKVSVLIYSGFLRAWSNLVSNVGFVLPQPVVADHLSQAKC